MAEIDSTRLTRRQVLQTAAFLTLGGMVVGTLQACGSQGPVGPTGAASGQPAPAPPTAAPAAAKPSVTIRVNYGTTAAVAPFFIAVHNKLYDKWNVKTEQFPMAGSAAALEGIAAGQLDTATVVAFTGLSAYDKGVPINAIFSYGYGGNRMAIVARPDAGIKTVKDLKGKRVAANFGTGTHQLLILALKSAGIGMDELQLFNMSWADMASGFASKNIDAASGIDPNIPDWVKKGLVVVVEPGGKYFAGPGTYVIRRELIEKYPEDVYRFTLAVLEAYSWVRTKGQISDEVVDLTATLVKQEKESTREALRNMVMDPRFTPYLREEIRKDGEYAISQGALTKIPDIDKFLVPTFLERAQKEHPELFADMPAYLKQMNITEPTAQ